MQVQFVTGTIAGSFLFGTHHETSDVDVRCIHLPNRQEILLGRRPKEASTLSTLTSHHETIYDDATQAISDMYGHTVSVDRSQDGEDIKSFVLQRFLELVADGEITCVEQVFTPAQLFISHLHNPLLWDQLQQDVFPHILNRNTERSVGFCNGIMVNFRHRSDRLASAIEVQKAFKSVFGSSGRHHKLQDFHEQLNHLYELEYVEFDETDPKVPLMRVCDRGFQYTASIFEAQKSIDRLVDTYGKRAHRSQNMQKTDWKSVSHAMRVSEQILELHETGKITFPRHNSQYLQQIREGLHDVDLLMDVINERTETIESMNSSVLPEKANIDLMNDYLMELHTKIVNGND